MRNKLKERRLELGLTLQEVANKVGGSAATVSRWESGEIENMRSDKIELLAKALKMDPLEIIGIEISEKSPLSNLTKKEKLNYDKFMNEATYYFNDESISDEDKEKLFKSLQEVYFTVMLGKKKKIKKYSTTF